MNFGKLTLRSVTTRSVLVPLRRPIVSKVGLFDQWPMILIELATEQGIVGRSYLEPYLKHAARYIVPAIHDLAEQRKGHAIRPIEDFQNGRRVLNLIGYEGVSMIAVRARYGGMGRTGAGGRHAAGGLAGRLERSGAGLQQQWPMAYRGSRFGRRRSSACRRRRLQGPQAALGPRQTG